MDWSSKPGKNLLVEGIPDCGEIAVLRALDRHGNPRFGQDCGNLSVSAVCAAGVRIGQHPEIIAVPHAPDAVRGGGDFPASRFLDPGGVQKLRPLPPPAR